MLMSTTADWLVDDESVDPDTLKVPENPKHRAIVETIAVVARHYLGTDAVVYRDMNWYPPDGSNPMAPDVMTLPTGALGPEASSYRQVSDDRPFPGVVVEVPSPSDTFEGLRAKAARYNSFGIDVYIVSVEPFLAPVLRLAPGSSDFVSWSGRPIDSLGGLSIEVINGDTAVLAPDGRTFTTRSDVLGMVIEADHRTARAEQRAAELEAKLRSLGVEP